MLFRSTVAALGDFGGHLVDDVRVELGAGYGIDAELHGGRTGSWISVGGAFDPAKASRALASVLGSIRSTRGRGIDVAELEGARSRIAQRNRRSLATVDGAASAIADAHHNGSSAIASTTTCLCAHDTCNARSAVVSRTSVIAGHAPLGRGACR